MRHERLMHAVSCTFTFYNKVFKGSDLLLHKPCDMYPAFGKEH